MSGESGIVLRLSGFAQTDTLDLASFAAAGASFFFAENKAKTIGTLTITDGKLQATVTLFGQYVAAGFNLGSDGGTGTAITYISA